MANVATTTSTAAAATFVARLQSTYAVVAALYRATGKLTH